MGQRGKNATKEKPWADALRLEIHREDEGDKRKNLAHIAEACVRAAKQGDMQAIKEIGDRLDGRPLQQNENHTTHDVGDTLADVFERLMDRNAGR